MSGPPIYIGTYTIKSGKLEECRQGLGELVDRVETNEPRLIAFHIYLGEQGGKISVVQVHRAPASAGSQSQRGKRCEPHDRGGGTDLPTRVMQSAMGSATLAR